MESEISVRADSAERIRELWQIVEQNRDQAAAAAGLAVKSAIECGQIIAELRDDFGNAGWVRWMTANVPNMPIAKATRLATIGPKYRDLNAAQLEFRTVKELYQATDLLPPPPPTHTKSKVIDTNWPKLVQKLEAMVKELNDGQKELLRKALVKLAEGL